MKLKKIIVSEQMFRLVNVPVAFHIDPQAVYLFSISHLIVKMCNFLRLIVTFNAISNTTHCLGRGEWWWSIVVNTYIMLRCTLLRERSNKTLTINYHIICNISLNVLISRFKQCHKNNWRRFFYSLSLFVLFKCAFTQAHCPAHDLFMDKSVISWMSMSFVSRQNY